MSDLFLDEGTINAYIEKKEVSNTEVPQVAQWYQISIYFMSLSYSYVIAR